ncbi:MAG: lysophospholipid acyltransferase family protein [Leptospirales bacterium]|nr:lysophospholipid acyltransferase family protein [Leptospirales bacterium]HMU82515.1 lysophospholipid acyltransferase family protein [Leptospiraceae bacterium]HMZ37189.1 lysophospholipid acyltransferase family protein [Leptospiraceae bacterium]HNJ03866.1 lysophospholipid acyltransferase family protein [Leptospiraceae bacterium]HNJ34649.1 lysophospholipid acyltransferase family protein [Leptospiraceae bacterium]
MDRSRKFTFKERIQIAVIPRLVVWFQKLIGLTSKRINLGGEHFDSLHGANKPWIFAIWHTNVLYSPYLLRDLNTAVMISASRDGEFIESVVRQFGNTSIRGSTSRGGGAALKEMIGHLRKGFSAAITPDGPRGPALVVQPGLIMSAQLSQVAILPFHYECTRQKIAKSWDAHRLPLPFTTFVCSYGEPILIPRQLSPEEFEAQRLKVERAMLENRERCIAEAKRLARPLEQT